MQVSDYFVLFQGTIPDLKSAVKKLNVPGGMAVLRYNCISADLRI